MFVFSVGVVGAGVMGAHIAVAVASAGELPVVVRDVDEHRVQAALAEARAVCERRAERSVERRTATPEQARERLERTLGLISGASGWDAMAGVDLVIEAVPEDLELKRAVFAELDARAPGHAILASNTSSLPITSIADAVSFDRRGLVVGMHFFWPAAAMRLVEVAAGEQTSPETLQAALSFARLIRKSPIACADSPGFVVNRVLGAMNTELWAAQEAANAPVEEVDRLVRDSGLMAMGPFELADMVGLDTVVRVAADLREAHGDGYGVHAGMEELVARGDLGAKTGRGFYAH